MRWHRRLTVLCAGGTRLAPTETECRPTKHMKNQASDMAGYVLFIVLDKTIHILLKSHPIFKHIGNTKYHKSHDKAGGI